MYQFLGRVLMQVPKCSWYNLESPFDLKKAVVNFEIRDIDTKRIKYQMALSTISDKFGCYQNGNKVFIMYINNSNHVTIIIDRFVICLNCHLF